MKEKEGEAASSVVARAEDVIFEYLLAGWYVECAIIGMKKLKDPL